MLRRHQGGNSIKWPAIVLLLIFLPLWLPLLLVSVAFSALYGVALYLLVWILWMPRGKDILFVYSDSPIWQEYMLTKVLPLVKDRAVVMNWSERSKWSGWSFRVQVFQHFGGDRDFNPLVVTFRPLHRAKKFRFWSAFKDWKHGNQAPVERLRDELAALYY